MEKKSLAPTSAFHAASGPIPKSVRASIKNVSIRSKSISRQKAEHENSKMSIMLNDRKSTVRELTGRKSMLRDTQKSILRNKLSILHQDGGRSPILQGKASVMIVDNPNRIAIPGNAGASIITNVALNSMPDMNHPHRVSALDSELGRPSILRLQATSPSALQMETIRQNQQLNRMASIRHSMAVQAINTAVGIEGSATTAASKQPRFSAEVLFSGRASTVVEKGSNVSAFTSRRRFTILKPEDANDPERNRKLKPVDEEWETVTSVRANDLYGVTKYRSRTTGMDIVHARLESPTVHGYFVIGTKCENDWGLPHILEHMIFLGSKNYPFPGVLDQLASKCLASGVDAWTDSDHSCYTVTTAGKEGFLSLLPIYMDHIFFPLLGEAGYMTEVHHINGEGKDGGVCYKEMQAIEHDPAEQAHWTLLREIYNPKSGYYYNYGGYCKEMRDSCNLQAVKNFHKKFYHPKNTCLIICGDMDKEEILKVVNPFIDVLKEAKAVPETWEKPWSSELPVEVREHDVETTVKFPSEHEGIAFVKIGIVGPTVTQDVTKSVGYQLLMHYLLDSPIAPIQKEFVGKEFALASHVNLTDINHMQSLFCLNFENVAVEDVKEVPKVLRAVLVQQIESEFDLERMNFIVGHCFQQALSAMENDAEKTIARALISDFLYGNNDALVFDRRVNNAYTIEQFADQPAHFWIQMIQNLLDSHWAIVNMVPSQDAHAQYVQEEEQRIQDLHDKIGDAGKKKLNARLKAAMKIQGRPPPATLLNSVTTPSISSIGFLGIERLSNPSWAHETLCNVYLDDINSSYIYLTVMMDTSELTLEEKKYLVLFAEAIIQSPYIDNSERYFTYEQTIAGLNRDVLDYETFFGIDWDPKEGNRFTCGNYSHLFCIRFQLEMKKVKEGFEWMQVLLWNTKWQADRLKIIAHGLAQDVDHLVDQGAVMTHAILKDSMYQMNSNVKACNLIRQQSFLRRLASDLPKSFKKIAQQLEAIRMVILRPENTCVHVATSLPKMEFYLTDKPEVRDAIAQLLRRTFDYTGWNWGYDTKRLANSPDHKCMKGEACIRKCVTEQILRMHSDEGSYLIQAAPCMNQYSDPHYPLLLTAIQYFCQHEGPFYRGIRSTGYASGYLMQVKPYEGMMYFELKPCSDLVGAYCAAFDIIVQHLNKESDPLWSESLLQSAKSSLIFELIETENTPRNIAMQSLLNYYHEVDSQFTRRLMSRISKVTMEDIKLMTKIYLRTLFIETSTCAAAAPAEKVPGIIKGLMDHCGKRLALLPPIHQSEMADFTS